MTIAQQDGGSPTTAGYSWGGLPAGMRPPLLAALMVGVVLASFWAGQRNPRVAEEEVRCLSAEGAISCELSDGWTIGVPTDAHWTDVTGAFHGGGRPECLPPTGKGLQDPVRVAWSAVEVDGIGWRQVLMVTCLS